MPVMAASTDPDIRLLQALADPTRLTIVRELAGQAGVCACDFTSCCDVSQPTISHHLKVLREAGVIESERQGTSIVYRLRPEAAARLERITSQIRVDIRLDPAQAGTRVLNVLPAN